MTQSTINNVATNYTYDGEGRRVMKSTPGQNASTVYVYDAGGGLAAEYTTETVPASGTEYLADDHLGSTRLAVTATGGVLKRYDYLPFGEEIFAGTDNRSATTYNAPIAVASTEDTVNNKFTGKLRDNETGLDYFGARYFSAAQGRFTTPDWSAKPTAVPYADLTNPQTLNLYSYVNNNPLNRADPLGHDWFNVDNKWQWQKGHVYHDAKGNALKIKGYEYLLRFTIFGPNDAGGLKGTLALFHNGPKDKVLSVPAFTGGSDSSHLGIPSGQYTINLAKQSTLGPSGIAQVAPGSWATKPAEGVQFIPERIIAADGSTPNMRWEWGDVRMRLDPVAGESGAAYQNNYLHGKERPGDTTHNCICDRTEDMIKEVLTLPTPVLPVQVEQ